MVNYSKKRILVTGGTGFIGGRLAERLTFEEGADVRVLVHDWRHAVWVSRTPATLIKGDVTKPESLSNAMDGCQIVFHCVGVGGSVETCQSVNVAGTRNVLRAALDAGVGRVVYLSSIAVHGPNPPDNANEATPFVRTGAPYGDSKIAAEEAIVSFTHQHPLPVVILRPTFVWGPRSQWFTVEPIRHILAGDWYLVDRGAGTCHAVHVDNLVDAMLLAGQRPEAAGEAFIITDGQPCTWAEFFLDYARIVGISRLPTVSSRVPQVRWMRVLDKSLGRTHDLLGNHMPGLEPARFLFRGTRFVIRHMRRRLGVNRLFSDWDLIKYARRGWLDTTKARDLLGYVPRVSRTEGMRQTELWLRDQRIIP